MSVLKGKRAVVSGSSRGIGRGIAIELAKAGADVVINYRSSPNEADEVVQICSDYGVQAYKVASDMGVQKEAEGLAEQAAELLGGLDIVVSNAAYSDRRLMLKQDLDEFRKTIDVTMYGAFYFLRRASQILVKANNGGNIVVIGSPMGHLGMPGAMPYNMAKAALNQMAMTMACELSEYRIRCNMVHPGWIDTPGERKFFSEETLQKKGRELPMGRLGRADEIGRGVVFLVDSASEYVTGSTLTIDGGIQMPYTEMFRVQEAEALFQAKQ
ncbi:Glucose 1-dehydrogenase 2 [Planctomycetes bacterium CA13]|uniref:Glucose 1-dehydrogenase 2 n=1 Tax=Novipirellula herctigrandis TaxID=2527986 RepID=A0A5C5YPJ2_9BACT|nr:Glucose 1-dehydrogenase 2 [Planctomycetes bacterium CA13]